MVYFTVYSFFDYWAHRLGHSHISGLCTAITMRRKTSAW